MLFGEPKERSADDVQRHFERVLCAYGKKPTGNSTLTDLQRRAQRVWKNILTDAAAQDFGASSEDDIHTSTKSDSNDDGDDGMCDGAGHVPVPDPAPAAVPAAAAATAPAKPKTKNSRKQLEH